MHPDEPKELTLSAGARIVSWEQRSIEEMNKRPVLKAAILP